MMRLSSPLSAWRIALHHHPVARPLGQSHQPHPLWDRMKKATHWWLLRILALLVALGCLTFVCIELFVGYVPLSAWMIVLLMAGLTAYVYVVVLINGHWNEQRHRMELDPIISLLILAMLLLIVVAWVRTMLLGEQSWLPYLDALGVGLAVLLATTLIAFIER